MARMRRMVLGGGSEERVVDVRVHAAVAACSCYQCYFGTVVVGYKNEHHNRKSIAHIAAPTKPGTCVGNNRSISHASQNTTCHTATIPSHQHDDYDYNQHHNLNLTAATDAL